LFRARAAKLSNWHSHLLILISNLDEAIIVFLSGVCFFLWWLS
jgi:hypothetical protein